MSSNAELARAAADKCLAYIHLPDDEAHEEMTRDIHDTYAPAMADYERLRSGGWIKCSERMPAVGEWVLTALNSIVKIRALVTRKPIWIDEDGYHEDESITHWQPLPEPPRNERT